MPTKIQAKSSPDRSRKVIQYASISAGSFILGVAMLLLILINSPTIAKFQLFGSAYYVVLVAMGLAAAGFLFGALKSSALYKGQQVNGNLQLGGPVVAFFLTVLLGLSTLPKPHRFETTIFLHGSRGLQDVVVKTGWLHLNLGSESRAHPIRERGQVDVPNIPSDFLNRTVPVTIDSEDYALKVAEVQLSPEAIYLEVESRGQEIVGFVRNNQGAKIAQALVHSAFESTTADDQGRFVLASKRFHSGERVPLTVSAPGYRDYRDDAIVGSNELFVVLSPP